MKRTTNHIEEYFAQNETNKDVITSKELFNADKNLDIKTELNIQEIVLLNKISYYDQYLETQGLNPVFKNFLTGYQRFKISFERKSRTEFVNMNRGNNTEEVIDKFSQLSTIKNTKQ